MNHPVNKGWVPLNILDSSLNFIQLSNALKFSKMTTTSTSKSEFKKDSNLINDQENITIEPDDPCNNYEWSVMFLLMLILALTFITIESLAMFRRRKSSLQSC